MSAPHPWRSVLPLDGFLLHTSISTSPFDTASSRFLSAFVFTTIGRREREATDPQKSPLPCHEHAAPLAASCCSGCRRWVDSPFRTTAGPSSAVICAESRKLLSDFDGLSKPRGCLQIQTTAYTIKIHLRTWPLFQQEHGWKWLCMSRSRGRRQNIKIKVRRAEAFDARRRTTMRQKFSAPCRHLRSTRL